MQGVYRLGMHRAGIYMAMCIRMRIGRVCTGWAHVCTGQGTLGERKKNEKERSTAGYTLESYQSESQLCYRLDVQAV